MVRLAFRPAVLSAVAASALCFALLMDVSAQSSDSSHASVPDFSGYWARKMPLPSTFLIPLEESLPGTSLGPTRPLAGRVALGR